MLKKVDKIIIGAGIYGLYAALFCAKKGEKIVVLEYDSESFGRASYVNQARVHNGYHYPRSYSTAKKSQEYFARFNKDFEFAVMKNFNQIYATAKNYSYTNSQEFKKFCDSLGVKCKEVDPSLYFNKNTCTGCFETEEYTFDAKIIRDYFISSLKEYSNVEIIYSSRIHKVEIEDINYICTINDNIKIISPFVLNATYGSCNQIIKLFDYSTLNINYELCEMILCDVSTNIKNVGITVMDGNFFSVMPFGKTGLHSLSSVPHTPQKECKEELPVFSCQKGPHIVNCSPNQLENCNYCKNKPNSSWNDMKAISSKFLKDDINILYKESIFAIKVILNSSGIDDSRPTIINISKNKPTFASVFSGKINTIYELEEIL